MSLTPSEDNAIHLSAPPNATIRMLDPVFNPKNMTFTKVIWSIHHLVQVGHQQGNLLVGSSCHITAGHFSKLKKNV